MWVPGVVCAMKDPGVGLEVTVLGCKGSFRSMRKNKNNCILRRVLLSGRIILI